MLEMLFPLMIISLIGGVIFFAILRNDLLRNRKVGIIGLCVSIAIFVSIMLYGIFGTPYNPSGCSNCGREEVFANELCENCWNSMVDDVWYDN